MSIIDMDPKHKLILESINEFLDTARDSEKKNRLKSAITMFFKAIVEAADLHIYKKILKVPENHKERFDILKKYDYELNQEIHSLFNIYRKTYSQEVDITDLVIIKNGTKKILKKLEIDKTLAKISEEKRD